MSLNGPAAARLYDDHVDAIYAYAARRIGADLAVDVVGEVFEHALARHTESRERGSDLGWLLAITTSMLRRHGAAERGRLLNWGLDVATARPTLEVGDPLLGSTPAVRRDANTAAIMTAVAELEPSDRDLLFLSAWEHCSTTVLSEATGVSPGNVRSRLSALRKELKRRVAANQPELNDEIEA